MRANETTIEAASAVAILLIGNGNGYRRRLRSLARLGGAETASLIATGRAPRGGVRPRGFAPACNWRN